MGSGSLLWAFRWSHLCKGEQHWHRGNQAIDVFIRANGRKFLDIKTGAIRVQVQGLPDQIIVGQEYAGLRILSGEVVMRFREIGVNGQDDVASFQHSDQCGQKKWLIPKKETHRLASSRIMSEEFPGNPIGGGIQLVVGECGLMVLDG